MYDVVPGRSDDAVVPFRTENGDRIPAALGFVFLGRNRRSERQQGAENRTTTEDRQTPHGVDGTAGARRALRVETMSVTSTPQAPVVEHALVGWDAGVSGDGREFRRSRTLRK